MYLVRHIDRLWKVSSAWHEKQQHPCFDSKSRTRLDPDAVKRLNKKSEKSFQKKQNVGKNPTFAEMDDAAKVLTFSLGSDLSLLSLAFGTFCRFIWLNHNNVFRPSNSGNAAENLIFSKTNF